MHTKYRFSLKGRRPVSTSLQALHVVAFAAAINAGLMSQAQAWTEIDLSKTESGRAWLSSKGMPSDGISIFSTWFSSDPQPQNPSDPSDAAFEKAVDSGSNLTSLAEALLQDQESNPADSVLRAKEWTFTPGIETSGHGIQSLRLQSAYKGIPVIGGRVSIVAHRPRAGLGSLLLQEAFEPFDLSTKPSVAINEATAQAANYAPGFAVTALPQLRVVVSPAPAPARLIWLTPIRNPRRGVTLITWLDAHSGEWIAAMPVRLTIAPIHVYQADLACQEVDSDGAPTALDLGRCPAVIMNGKPMLRAEAGRPAVAADESALRAAQNSKRVLQYFLDQHSRDSYDGKSSQVINVVHIGKKFDNAFWDDESKMMAYGDGDGEVTGDFTLGLDVAGHEMTHGVISATANLVYADESGALNEAYADFFGKMIENEGDWTIGRKLFLDPAAAEGFRDLKEPGRIQYTIRNDSGKVVSRPYPTTVSEKATTRKPCDDARNDNCFVHINSTIPGHAFYQLQNKVGKRAAERIVYSTLTHFLSETSNFNENAKAMRTACRELYASGDTCSKLDEVLGAVGFTY